MYYAAPRTTTAATGWRSPHQSAVTLRDLWFYPVRTVAKRSCIYGLYVGRMLCRRLAVTLASTASTSPLALLLPTMQSVSVCPSHAQDAVQKIPKNCFSWLASKTSPSSAVQWCAEGGPCHPLSLPAAAAAAAETRPLVQAVTAELQLDSYANAGTTALFKPSFLEWKALYSLAAYRSKFPMWA